MHLQIRAPVSKSPPDLAAFLDVLAEADVNLLGAGGSNVEQDGEFAFAVMDGEEKRAVRVLEEAGYAPRIVDIKLCWLDNRPGELLKCINEAQLENGSERVIRDLLIGVPDDRGRIPVQVYSERSQGSAS